MMPYFMHTANTLSSDKGYSRNLSGFYITQVMFCPLKANTLCEQLLSYRQLDPLSRTFI